MEKNVRQLAAVMFTDMVGYTALMQEDEQKARSDRDRHREVLERLIRENQGSILQYFGDGTLSVFDSAINAVECALEIQVELQKEPIIPVRVGLHVGDIVYEADGVYGDAVNVASRIEAISVPGAVLLSQKVFDDIKNHPEFPTVSLGEFKFKNMKCPVEIFALKNPQLTVPGPDDLKGKACPTIKSIAVLPFVNISSDPENEYFSYGMTEELINAFTKVEGLEVTARTSSFSFKGKDLDIREIGSQLNVDTILEGSVRKAGNKVRITAQLVNTADGYHLFSETYDRNLEDIFEVQDEIANKITQKLTSQLDGCKIKKSLVKSRTENLEAYSIYLKGIFYWNKWTPDNMKKAIEFFEKALEMEPDFASVYSWLAYTYTALGTLGNLLPRIAYSKAEEYAHKALELDDELYNSHLALAMVKIFFEWDFFGAYQSIQRATQLNPGAGRVHYAYALYLQVMGRMEEAVKEMEQAARLDPLSQPINNHLAHTYYATQRYDDALGQLDKILEIYPTHRPSMELKGQVLLAKGEKEKAIQTLEQHHTFGENDVKGLTSLGFAYARADRSQDAQKCLEKLQERQQQEKQELLSVEFVILYIGLGDFDKAFYHLEKAIEARLGGVMFLRSNPALKEFCSEPRFKALMKKIGLGNNS